LLDPKLGDVRIYVNWVIGYGLIEGMVLDEFEPAHVVKTVFVNVVKTSFVKI
jgi:hypothetical protein